MRIEAQDVAVLAGAGLGFVGIDHEIGGPRRIGCLGMNDHLRPVGKSGAAAPAQIRFLDLVDDGIAAPRQQLLGVVPDAALARAGQAPVVRTP